jgi:hypothetical protein
VYCPALLQVFCPTAGLDRRFQFKDPWKFEDYGDEDLLHIMRKAAKDK